MSSDLDLAGMCQLVYGPNFYKPNVFKSLTFKSIKGFDIDSLLDNQAKLNVTAFINEFQLRNSKFDFYANKTK
jgi:hypothetical protein